MTLTISIDHDFGSTVVDTTMEDLFAAAGRARDDADNRVFTSGVDESDVDEDLLLRAYYDGVQDAVQALLAGRVAASTSPRLAELLARVARHAPQTSEVDVNATHRRR